MSYGIKHVIKDAVTGNLKFASNEVQQARFALCEVCPHRRENIPGYKKEFEAKDPITPWSVEKDKCNLCGCYMPVKTKLADAKCPVNKW